MIIRRLHVRGYRSIDKLDLPLGGLHEFEVHLFSHIDSLQRILNEAREPDYINDNPNKSPSKRLISLYPSYKKTLDSSGISQKFPLSRIQDQCIHFDSRLSKLENLPSQTGEIHE